MDESDLADQQQSRAGIWMMVVAWLILLAMGTIFYQDLLFKKENPNTGVYAQIEGEYLKVTLQADKNGHFIVGGSINGQPARFLLDTGASDIAVPGKLRDHFQLDVLHQTRAHTANGVVTVGSTVIQTLEVAGFKFLDVKASINPGMDYSDLVLLGMSALSKLEINIQGGTVTLSQRLEL